MALCPQTSHQEVLLLVSCMGKRDKAGDKVFYIIEQAFTPGVQYY